MHDPGEARPLKVLVVGQLPPPYGGQAVAIESFVRGCYARLQLHPVRMGFSDDMAEVGRVRARKLARLVALVARILWRRVRTGATVLYYPPGSGVVPVLRDVAILICTRWAFRQSVFHFHAAGLSELGPRLPRPLRALVRFAYRRPDLAIQPSELNPPDGRFVDARRTVIVPCGVPDDVGRPPARRRSSPPVILYVGVLRESKGLLVLVAACRELRRRGVEFRLRLMGQLESADFDRRLRAGIGEAGLDGRVEFLGVCTGADKYAAFCSSDVFCYPTYFESETFGIVVVEAMKFALPVVATRWRGVPSIVEEGRTGFLVPVHDAAALADRLEVLVTDEDLAQRMGAHGRQAYLSRYTEDSYRTAMEDALMLLTERPGA